MLDKTNELIGPGGTAVVAGFKLGEETFTHSILGTFNVSRIARHVRSREPVIVDITNGAMTRDRDFDEHRVAEIMSRKLFSPVLLLDCEDGTHLLIDGLHRVIARRRLGLDYTPARIATLTEVKPFMVTISARRADGTPVDQAALTQAMLEDDQGRHNGPDGRPRPGSTSDMVLPVRKEGGYVK